MVVCVRYYTVSMIYTVYYTVCNTDSVYCSSMRLGYLTIRAIRRVDLVLVWKVCNTHDDRSLIRKVKESFRKISNQLFQFFSVYRLVGVSVRW